MAKYYRVTLTLEEQCELERIIKHYDSKARQVKRSYVLLAADENGDKNWTDKKIADTYKVSRCTIERLRKRFVEDSLEIALYGKPRPINKERIFDGRVESQLIALRCSSAPKGYKKWSLRLLADKMVELEYVDNMSHESVRQLLKKTKLSLGK